MLSENMNDESFSVFMTGTTKHEETSSHAMESIFKFFAEEEDLD